MAKKPSEPAAEKPAAVEAPAPAKRRLPKKAILIGGVAIAQIALLYGVTKFFGGGPQPVLGHEGAPPALHGAPPEIESQTAELEVLKSFRVPNESRGRLFIYDLDISVKIRAFRKSEVEKVITDRKGEISDRVASIVRSATQDMLHEPDLRTLRGKLMNALGDVAGDRELVLEVLIPRCVPIPA